MMMLKRGEITLIVTKDAKSGKEVMHFCSHSKLSGLDGELWFPLNGNMSLFQNVELVLTLNNVAYNLVGLQLLRVVSDHCRDYTAIYNQP